MMYIMHPQKDEIIGYLDREDYWFDEHQHGLDGVHFIEFTTHANSEESKLLVDRCRLLRQSSTGGWMEFVAYHIGARSDRTKQIMATGSEAELDMLKVMEPGWRNGLTLDAYVVQALQGTGWEMGVIDYGGSKSRNVTQQMGAYSFLKWVANLYDRELRFRIEISGNRIVGRYVDVVERVGADKRQELVAGENMAGIERIVHSDRIVTALYCIGPQREDGTRLTVLVTDEDAFQRWNWKGQHLVAIYEPESEDADMTLERLTSLGNMTLKKRIDSVVEYIIDEAILPDSDVQLGDTVPIKDEGFEPPLYAESRSIHIKEPISGEVSKRTHTFGEIVELDEEEVMASARRAQAEYGMKLIRSDAEPVVQARTLWIQTDPQTVTDPTSVDSGTFEVPHVANADLTAWTPLTATTAAEIGAVDTADFNGMKLMELLNAPDVTARLLAGKIQLVGAVEVLSDITGNLGTITAGKIQVLQIEGGGKQIVFGADIANFDGRIDYNDGAMRFQSDGATYLKVNKGGTTGFNGPGTSTSLFQLFVANTPLFNFGQSDEGLGHRTLQGGTVRLKFLNGTTPALQVRNVADTALIPIHASELVTNSVRETKKNILPYTGDALTEVMTTAVHSYQLNEDTEHDMKRIGLIYDESPVEIVSPSGFGIDVYAMATMNWRATQQLKEEKDALQGEVDVLKAQMLDMQQAIAELTGNGATQ